MHPIERDNLATALRDSSFAPLRRFAATARQCSPRIPLDQSLALVGGALSLASGLWHFHRELLQRDRLRIAVYNGESMLGVDQGAWWQTVRGFFTSAPEFEIDLIHEMMWAGEPMLGRRSAFAGLAADLPKATIYDDPDEYDLDARNPDLVLFVSPDWVDDTEAIQAEAWVLPVFERGGPMLATAYDPVSAAQLALLMRGLGLADCTVVDSPVHQVLDAHLSPPTSFGRSVINLQAREQPGAFIDLGAVEWAIETAHKAMETQSLSGRSYEPGALCILPGEEVLAVGLLRRAADIQSGQTYRINERGVPVKVDVPARRHPWTPVSREACDSVPAILNVVEAAFAEHLFDADMVEAMRENMADPQHRERLLQFVQSAASDPGDDPLHHMLGEMLRSQAAMAGGGEPEALERLSQIFQSMAGQSGAEAGNALFLAVAQNDADAVRRAIAAGESVNQRDTESWTPLIDAASRNAVEAADALIAAGADIEGTNAFGHRPLVIALSRGHHETALRLLQAGANPDAATPMGTARDYLRRTRLSPALAAWLAINPLR